MHGKDLPCAEAESRREDAGLYIVATDPQGNPDRTAKVFIRLGGYYTGLNSVLNGSAFEG
jgi:hypothetical protein